MVGFKPDSSALGFHLWLTVDTDTVFLHCLSRPSLPIILPGTIEQHTVCHPTKDHRLPWLVFRIVFNGPGPHLISRCKASCTLFTADKQGLIPHHGFHKAFLKRTQCGIFRLLSTGLVSWGKWRLGGTTVHWVPVKLLLLSPKWFQ